MGFGEVTFSMTQVQDKLQEKLGALKYENGNVEAQWTNIKKYVFDTTSDLVVKVDRRARKPWITQWMKVDRKELKRATGTKKEYLEIICRT